MIKHQNSVQYSGWEHVICIWLCGFQCVCGLWVFWCLFLFDWFWFGFFLSSSYLEYLMVNLHYGY